MTGVTLGTSITLTLVLLETGLYFKSPEYLTVKVYLPTAKSEITKDALPSTRETTLSPILTSPVASLGRETSIVKSSPT